MTTTPRFFKLPQDLTARRDLTATDKLVYAVIQNRMDQRGVWTCDVCYEQAKREKAAGIVHLTGLSEAGKSL